MKKTKRMKISKKSMESQMEFLKPVTAARMNSRATSEKNILNSTPKNLYRFAFSGKFTFLSQAQITFILRSNSNHYISFLPKIKAFSILICVPFVNFTLILSLKRRGKKLPSFLRKGFRGGSIPKGEKDGLFDGLALGFILLEIPMLNSFGEFRLPSIKSIASLRRTQMSEIFILCFSNSFDYICVSNWESRPSTSSLRV